VAAAVPYVPTTVSVRVSVLVALLLVGSGTALYVVGGQPTGSEPPAARIEVSQDYGPGPDTANFSALTHEQRAAFLLANDPEEYGSYETNDTELAAAIEAMPERVRYDGTVYEVSRPGGHTDTLSDPFFSAETVGAAVAIIGALALAATEIQAFRRR